MRYNFPDKWEVCRREAHGKGETKGGLCLSGHPFYRCGRVPLGRGDLLGLQKGIVSRGGAPAVCPGPPDAPGHAGFGGPSGGGLSRSPAPGVFFGCKAGILLGCRSGLVGGTRAVPGGGRPPVCLGPGSHLGRAGGGSLALGRAAPPAGTAGECPLYVGGAGICLGMGAGPVPLFLGGGACAWLPGDPGSGRLGGPGLLGRNRSKGGQPGTSWGQAHRMEGKAISRGR